MRKTGSLLAVFILVKFLLQYWVLSPEYDLQRDEYLHLDQAHHPAWGFQSVPPVTSWISLLIYWLGNSVFWVKFFPALFGALTIIVVWQTIRLLGGGWFALSAGAMGVLFSALLRLNTLFQPNSLDVLCWTALFACWIYYVHTRKSRWLYMAALIFALGFLNKYNIVFLAAAFLPSILLTPQRSLLLNRHILQAAFLSLCLISPNLWWQYKQHFPVIHHMQELATTQLIHVNRLEFLQTQPLFFMGWLPVIIAGWMALIFYRPFSNYRAFAWALPLTLALFTYLKAKAYYSIGLYPVYGLFGCVYLEQLLRHSWKKWMRPAIILLPLLAMLPLFPVLFPNKRPEEIIQNQEPYRRFGLLRWEDGKDHALPQDFADMLGWKEMTRIFDSVYQAMPHPEQTLVLCDNYGQAGAINYYTRHRVRAYSFNADYLYWIPFDQPVKDVMLVRNEMDDDPERRNEKPLFDSVYRAARRIHPLARETVISFYVLLNARVDVNARIKAEAEREMAKARRGVKG